MGDSLATQGALSGMQRWLESWWPSARLRKDPLSDWRVEDRYAAVSIANWKLTPRMSRLLLERRIAQPLTFSDDKRLSIVIPFRDREEHLRELMPRLTATLADQRIAHRVIVVEQEPGALFNRGKLLNIGIHHAAADTDYYCLHDVDAVPIVANYRCPSQPLRLVNTIRTPRGDSQQRTDYYFSGAVSIRKQQVFAANGYSNEYWGWGKEDDDFFFRLLLAGFLCFYDTHGTFLDLPNPKSQEVAREASAMPAHVRENRRRRSRLQRGLMSPFDDGLSTLHYEVIERIDGGSYEKIRVRW